MSEPKRTSTHRRVHLSALLAVSALAGQASAQMRLDRYMAPSSPTDGFRVARPVGLDAGQLGGLLVLDYADDPLVMELERGLDDTETTRLVRSQLEAHARLAYGLVDRLLLSGGLDFAVMMVGDSHRDAATETTLAPADGSGLGDAHLAARYVLLGAVDSPASLALDAKVSLPLARGANSDQSLSGERGATFHPELLGEVRSGALRVTGNFGTLLRNDSTLLDTTLGDEITFGVGTAVRLPGRMQMIELIAEAYGSTGIKDPFARNVTPVEAIAGGRWHASDQWRVSLAAGPGMGRGIGSPDVRAIASLGFVGAGESDLDGDLIADQADACPSDMEDRDGLGDHDGCPDTDDDGDTVHEPLDRCPAEREDTDGFQDQDGCPDLDDDADGVPDTADRCMGQSEDQDGFEDGDGCDDADDDGDGVQDAVDGCRNEAEDVDSFQDGDGCPDPDNDGDGVLDGEDRCPALAGAVENEGCAHVSVEGNHIRLDERIEFEINGTEILAGSESLLQQVRKLLEQNPQIRSVAIEGHTDGTGAAAHNQALSERRALAVMGWLVRSGIAAERLTAHGCGNTRPVADENDNDARRKNRRVELHILGDAPGSAASPGCVKVNAPPATAQ